MKSKVEEIKANSRFLRGDLHDEIYHTEETGVSDASYQLLKFHGVYQQDDRDERKPRRRQGHQPAYSFMIRVAIPGGMMSAEQYLALDEFVVSQSVASMRITSRQALQLHGLAKIQLPSLIRKLESVAMTSQSGCGDVVRNIMGCPLPTGDAAHEALREMALLLSKRLKPQSRAYFELWVEGERAWEVRDDEPLYGATYLPRKFKIGLAMEGDNCIDVYSQDIGIVAHSGAGGIESLSLLVGGGLALSHGVKETHARLAEPLGKVSPARLLSAVEAIVSVQRDFGNREQRRYARMKYLIDAWGVEKFRQVVEKRLPFAFDPPSELHFTPLDDHLGWHAMDDTKGVMGFAIPMGRIRDTETVQWQTGLRDIIREFSPQIILTPQQNLLLVGISSDQRAGVEKKAQAYGMKLPDDLPLIIRHGMACPALPTCGLALAEAERVFPELLEDIQRIWVAMGLGAEDLHVRMTGCPNNCARSFLAEIGIVGCGPGLYHLYIGGSPDGTRLNRLFKERVPLDKIPGALHPLFQCYRAQRKPGESLGDFYQAGDVGVTSDDM